MEFEMKNNTSYGQCRCCLVAGNHKHMMKEHYNNGKREVYFDMFMECFNLFLSSEPKLSTLICSNCVQRLQDASSFRTLTATSERQLLQSLKEGDKHTEFVNVPVEACMFSDVDVKSEHSDDPSEFSGAPLDNVSNYGNDGCVETDCDGLVRGEAELLARFNGRPPPLPTRRDLHTICPKYDAHLDIIKGKTITTRMIKILIKDKKRGRISQMYVTEKMAHIVNCSTLLQCSNAIPFRSKSRTGFPCFFCKHIYQCHQQLKEHTLTHKHTEIVKVLKTYGPEALVVYADVTDLKCTICDQNMSKLNDLKSHLIKVHKRILYSDYTDRLIPFKLSDQGYQCQVCGCSFETFGSIERHMNVHYRNYVCKSCGTGFVTKYRLKVHTKSMHVDGKYPCEICSKVFSTQQKYKNHYNAVHKMVKRFKCAQCPERFTEYFRRQKHMVEVHGVAPLQYKCNVCDKSFDRKYTLSRHLKRDHLEERDFQCELCAYKCFTNNELRVHMVKHNGERIHECLVCKKAYARKKTLKEHMRIHNNDRRFACAVCGQAFVQKCSLKGHLKTHHIEFTAGNVETFCV